MILHRHHPSSLRSLRRQHWIKWLQITTVFLWSLFPPFYTPAPAAYIPDSQSPPQPVWDGNGDEPESGPDLSDDDSDGLPNWFEQWLGSDVGNPDSDYDGLSDADEQYLTSTDPINWDSNSDGYSDHDASYGCWAVNHNEVGFGQSVYDWDGDGIYNPEDAWPLDANNGSYDPSTYDSDGDGYADADDSHPYDYSVWGDWGTDGDSNGDPGGDPDPGEGDPGEGDPEPTDDDSDDDGFSDGQDSDPNDSSLWDDANRNGINDSAEVDPYANDADNDTIVDAHDSHPWDAGLWSDWNSNNQNDEDETGSGGGDPPPEDPVDSDGDGIVDSYDSHPSNSALYSDWDFNGQNDHEENSGGGGGDPPEDPVDSDGDTVLDPDDSHPNNFSLWNDFNYNGINDDDNDPLVIDSDEDEVVDALDSHPSDSSLWNDFNHNGVNDEEPGEDQDGDGTINFQDSHPKNPSLWSDWDFDALNHEAEITHQTDPNHPDSDRDGLTDGEEVTYATAPKHWDTDNDSLSDFDELRGPFGSSAKDPYSLSKKKGWGSLYDDWQMASLVDTDGDGIPNRIEELYGLNPNNFLDASGDLDGDGITNLIAYRQGKAIFGIVTPLDRDGDGLTDAQEDFWGRRNPGLISKFNPEDAVKDPDNDDLMNWQEVVIGSNPGLHTSMANASALGCGDGTIAFWQALILPSSPDHGSALARLPASYHYLIPNWSNQTIPTTYDSETNTYFGGPALGLQAFLSDVPLAARRPGRQAQGDYDGDGMTDQWEWRYREKLKVLDLADAGPATGFVRTQILGQERTDDPDGDTLSNLREFILHTHPLIADTDGDGLSDGREIADGHDPLQRNTGSGTGGGGGGGGGNFSFDEFNPAGVPNSSPGSSFPDLKVEIRSTGYTNYRTYVFDEYNQLVSSSPNEGFPVSSETPWADGNQVTGWNTDSGEPTAQPNTGGGCSFDDFGVCSCCGGGGEDESGNIIPCTCSDEPGGSGTGWEEERVEDRQVGYIRAKLAEPTPFDIQSVWRKITITPNRPEPEIQEIVFDIPQGGTDAGQYSTYHLEIGTRATIQFLRLRIPEAPSEEPVVFPHYSASVSPSGPPLFRKIGTHGVPLRDFFPDPEDKNPEPGSGTYVDAFGGLPRHTIVDAQAIPAPGTRVSVVVRRDFAEEIWSNTRGLKFSERPDRPFGAGFVSNVCASATVEKIIIPGEGEGQGPRYRTSVTLVDDNGGTQNYTYKDGNWIPSKVQRLDKISANDVLVGPVDVEGNPQNFLLTRSDGSTCHYVMTSMVQKFNADRLQRKGAAVEVRYGRLSNVTDRHGQTLTYQYGNDTSLVASEIRSSIGDQVVTISSGSDGRVTSVASNSGDHTTFSYVTSQFGNDTVTYLSAGNAEGDEWSYRYLKAVEQDPTPLPDDPANPSEPELWYHVALAGVTDPLGADHNFSLELNHQCWFQQTYVPPNSQDIQTLSRVQTGMPHMVTSVSSPGGSATISAAVSTTVSTGGQAEVTSGATVSGSNGTFSFRFGGQQFVSLGADEDEAQDAHFPTAVVCSYDSISLSSPLGEESFGFDRGTGQLATYSDLEANSYSWTYGNGGRDCLSKQGPLGTRSFSYDNAGNLQSITTEKGITKTQVLNELGVPLWTNVFDAEGVLIFRREKVYENSPGRKTFASREIIKALHPELGESDRLVDVQRNAKGQVIDETWDPNGLALRTQRTFSPEGYLLSETDPKGRTTAYAYDPRGNLIQTQFPDGTIERRNVGPGGLVLSSVARDGTKTFSQYDLRGNRLAEVIDLNHDGKVNARSQDIVTEFQYDGLNQLVRTIDPRGISTIFTNGHKRVLSEERAGRVTRFEYGENSQRSMWEQAAPTTTIDPGGRKTVFELDQVRRIISEGTVIGQVNGTKKTRHPAGNPPTKQDEFNQDYFVSHGDPDFAMWMNSFSSQLLTDDDGATYYYETEEPVMVDQVLKTTKTYDAHGNVLSTTDPMGRETTYTYDALDRVVTVTLPDSQQRTTQYNAFGEVLSFSDEAGRTTNTVYDSVGRRSRLLLPSVQVASGTLVRPERLFFYDQADQLIAVRDEAGLTTNTEYDVMGRPIKVIAPPALDAASGVVKRAEVTTTYDQMGRVVIQKDSFGQTTSFVYDRAGRLIETKSPPVAVHGVGTKALITKTAYDADGNAIRVTDPAGRTTQNSFDDLNRLVVTTDPLGNTTTFGFDGSGNHNRVTDAKGNITQWTHDRLGRVTSEITPGGILTSFEYDGLLLTKKHDARGWETYYRYHPQRDWLLEVDEQKFIQATGTFEQNLRSLQYDTLGRLLTVNESAHPDASVAYQYDTLDRIVSETSGGLTHQHTYDVAGRRVQTRLGTRRTIDYGYDGAGRLNLQSENGRLTQWGYDLAGRAAYVAQANGLLQRNSYDALGRLASRKLVRSSSGGLPNTDVVSLTFQHDEIGNVRKLTEQWQAHAGAPTARTLDTSMSYDTLDRLVAETRSGSSGVVTTTYQYDAVSNRTRKTVSGSGVSVSETGSWDYQYNAMNQLTGFVEKASNGLPRKTAAYEYDPVGNRTRKLENGQETQRYDWDHLNRLVKVHGAGASPSPASYQYDYRMRRVSRHEGGVATRVSFAGGVSVAERQGAQLTLEQVRGPDLGGGVGGMLYSLRPGEVARYSTSNGRGDVIAQSDPSGGITWSTSYEGYGKRAHETGTNLDRQRANTKEEDPTGLLNEGFRYRDLETGTWLSRDPAGFVDGPNLYAYVKQDPWTSWDPHGLSRITQIKIAGEAVIDTGKKVLKALDGSKPPINAKYGKTGVKPLDDFSEDSLKMIREVDPNFNGQKFSPDGYPIFDDHAFKVGDQSRFPIPGMKGNKDMNHDNELLRTYLVNERKIPLSQVEELFETHTLHHVEGGNLAQLVPRAIHGATAHTGGSADIAAAGRALKAGAAGVFTALAPSVSDAYEKGGSAIDYGRALWNDAKSAVDPGFGDFADLQEWASGGVDLFGRFENLLINGSFAKPED